MGEGSESEALTALLRAPDGMTGELFGTHAVISSDGATSSTSAPVSLMGSDRSVSTDLARSPRSTREIFNSALVERE